MNIQCRSSWFTTTFVWLALIGSLLSLHSANASSPIVVSYTQVGMERSSTTAVDSQGNLYVAGSIDGFFGVLKYSPQGTLLWTYRNSLKGTSLSVFADDSGSVYVAGSGTTATQLLWLTVKLSVQGTELWSRTLGTGRAQTVIGDGSGGIYVGGTFTGTNPAPYTIARYTVDGTLLWQRAFATGFNDSFDGMVRDFAGNAIAVGRVVNASGDSIDLLTVKLNPQGTTLWQMTYGQTSRTQFPHDLAIDASGNTWITGESASTLNDGLVPPFTLQYSANGTLLRSVSQGGAAIALDSLGGVLITDTLAKATLNDLRPTVAKFDAQGNKLWETLLTTSEFGSSTLGSQIVVDDATSIFVAVTIDTNTANMYDFLISKLDTTGAILWQHRFNGANGMIDTVTSLQADAFGNVFTTGNSYTSCPSSPTGSCEIIASLIFPRGEIPSATSTLPSAQAPTSPAAPSNLTASASSASVTLNWRDNATNESGYRIERCTGNGCTQFLQIAEVGVNTVKFTDTGLARNTQYVYRVRAFNAGGNSTYSNSVSVKTPKK
jgi:hypothetical protein